MNNFHFAKIIAGVGPTLAKETVLSKVINMVDCFRMTLSWGFDDNNKNDVVTIMKLVNSKTILLETRGSDIRVKNVLDIKVKTKSTIEVDYSEYAQEHDKKIYIDAPFITTFKPGQQLIFQQSGVVLKVKSVKEHLTCEVIQWGRIIQFDKVLFPKFTIPTDFLNERDQKDILWWLEYGIHMIGTSMINSANDISRLKEFLKQRNAEKMKILAKIETEEALKHFHEILDVADGIILILDKIEPFFKSLKLSVETLISQCKTIGKPIIINFTGKFEKTYQHINHTQLKKFTSYGVDGYMLEALLEEEASFSIINELSETLDQLELKVTKEEPHTFYANNEYMVRDYILYNAYRAAKEVEVRAMVLYTENGYSAARLSSLKPWIPLISFTKNDYNYRYLNILWWVRGYKISQSFSYENLKRIGKEMIRIIFKGNISLDDKIIIVQANESWDEKTDMINGLELYKFKNI